MSVLSLETVQNKESLKKTLGLAVKLGLSLADQVDKLAEPLKNQRRQELLKDQVVHVGRQVMSRVFIEGQDPSKETVTVPIGRKPKWSWLGHIAYPQHVGKFVEATLSRDGNHYWKFDAEATKEACRADNGSNSNGLPWKDDLSVVMRRELQVAETPHLTLVPDVPETPAVGAEVISIVPEKRIA